MKNKYIIHLIFIISLGGLHCVPDPPLETTGMVTGIISKSTETTKKLENVTITHTASGASVSSNASGTYTMASLPEGQQQLTYSLTGYKTQTATVNIIAGQSITKNIDLVPSQQTFELSTTTLSFDRSNTTLNLDIKNISNTVLKWSITEDKAWLSTNPTNGEIPIGAIASVNVTIDLNALPTSSENTNLIITSTTGGSQTVAVSVMGGGALIAIPQNISVGPNHPVTKSILLTNGNPSVSLNYSVTSDKDWVKFSPSSGSITNETDVLNLTLDLNGRRNNDMANIVVNSNINTVTITVTYSVDSVYSPSKVITSSDITPKNASTIAVNGEITEIKSVISQRGHVWSSSIATPTLSVNTKTELGPTTTNGTFISTLENLSANTKYYIRAYIIDNNAQVVYGDVVEYIVNPISISNETATVAGYHAVDSVDVEMALNANIIENIGKIDKYGWLLAENSMNTTFENANLHLSKTKTYTKTSTLKNTARITFSKSYYVKSYVQSGKITVYGNTYKISHPSPWTKKASFPDQAGNYGATAQVYNNSIWVMGGSNGSNINKVYKYSPTTNTWSNTAGDNLPISVRFHQSFVSGGNLYSATGFSSSNISTVYRYNAGTWTLKNNFTGGALNSATSFVLNDVAYVGLGNLSGTSLKTFYRYNVSTDAWASVPDFSGVARYGAVAFVYQGEAYVGLGQASALSYLNNFYKYNSTTNVWTAIEHCPLSSAYASAFVVGNRIFVGLGFTENSKRSNKFYEYLPASNTWVTAPLFPGTHRAQGIALVSGNLAYIGLGNDGSSYNKDFWSFDPSINLVVEK